MSVIIILSICKAVEYGQWEIRAPTEENKNYASERLSSDASKYGFEKDAKLIQLIIAPKELIFLAERTSRNTHYRSRSQGFPSHDYERHYVYALQSTHLGAFKAICVRTRTVYTCLDMKYASAPKFFYQLVGTVQEAMEKCDLAKCQITYDSWPNICN